MKKKNIIKSSWIKVIQDLRTEKELEIVKLTIATHISSCLIKINDASQNLHYQSLIGKLFNNVFCFNEKKNII